MIINKDALNFLSNIRGSKNPQEIVLNMLKERSGNAPLFAEMYNLASQNKTKEVNELAKNICKEKGIDYDKEFKNFRKMTGF